jgi:hypothetical protein
VVSPRAFSINKGENIRCNAHVTLNLRHLLHRAKHNYVNLAWETPGLFPPIKEKLADETFMAKFRK